MRFSIEAIFKAVDNFTRPVARIQTRMGKFTDVASRGILSVGKSAINLVGRLGQIAVAAGAAAVAIGGIAIAKNIIDVGSDFEQAITNVGAVGLQTREQIAELEKEALRLGGTTKFTATEAANAMEIMARSGFKNSEILSGVGGVLSAAAASGLEMAEVADVVSGTLKGMGLKADQASRVADVLALASARTNSTIGSLGESMKNVASTARQLNIPLEDTVAAVALLQDVGLDASVSGSSLNTMLTKLAAPTKGMRAEMKKLGIAFEDSSGNALALPEILASFDTAAKKTGGNMKVVAFFSELVGLRGQKAAANLKDLFASGKVTTLTKELLGAKGVSEKMAALRMDTLKGDWTLLGSVVDGVKVSLFDLEGGPLRDIVQTTTKWVEANKELIKEKFQVVADFVKDVAARMPKILETLPTVVKWFKAFAAIATVAAVALGVLAAASLLFLAILFAPLTALIVAWAFFPEFFAELWEDVKDIASGVGDFFVVLWGGIKSFFVGTWNFIKGLAILAWASIRETFAAEIAAIKVLWDGIVFVFKLGLDGIAFFFNTLIDQQMGKWEKFKEAIGQVWDVFVAVFNAVIAPILDTVAEWIDKVANVGANSDTGGVAVARGGGFTPAVESASSALTQELRAAVQTNSELTVNLKDPSGAAGEVTSKTNGKLKVKRSGTD